MKKNKMANRVLSSVLAFAMLIGTCSTAFAAGSGSNVGGPTGGRPSAPGSKPSIPSTPGEQRIKYVSLGDSMTNGYGLTGYNGNNGVEDYGERSYANQFATWLARDGAHVDHKQLAMSAMRAEDLHWLLELDYNNADAIAVTDSDYNDGRWALFGEEEWREQFPTTGDYWTWHELCNNYRFASAAYTIQNNGVVDGKVTEGDAAFMAEYYQTAVEEADIISLGMGNGNFGVFAFGRLLEAIGFYGAPSDAMIYRIEDAISECAPELQTKILELKDTLYEKVNAFLDEQDLFAGDINADNREALLNTIVYTGLSYVLNYAGSLEAILQLNPDAKIILVALMNTFAEEGTKVDYSNIESLGDVMGAIFEPLNMFIAGLPTFMQAVNNGVYKDAKFYYAEAPQVECLVEVYEDEKRNMETEIPKRFVTSIVGTVHEPGMVWELLATMVPEMIDGASLEFISIDDIVAYEELEDSEKVAFAANPATKNNAISCALYLAFEDAILEASKGAEVDLASVMNLGGLNGSIFTPVMTKFNNLIVDAGLVYATTAIDFVAPLVANEINTEFGSAVINADTVKALMTGAQNINEVLTAIVTPMVEAEVKTQMSAHPSVTPIFGIHADLDEVLGCQDIAHGTNCSTIQAMYSTQVAENVTLTVNQYTPALQDGITAGNNNVSVLCMLLALPETLSTALQETPDVYGLLGLFARCIIGNGLGAHPSINGHNSLFEAVKTAYSERYTAKDQTIKNITAIINEYYDEAYAYAYAKADENGYVDIAADAIDKAIKVIRKLDISDVKMTDDFRTKLETELAETVLTLEEIKVILEEDKANDVNGLVNSVSALWDDLNRHLTNASEMLDQAEFDIKTLVVPVVDAYVSALVESFKDTAKTEIAKAGHKFYEADEDSFYVAIGGDTVYGTGINRNDKGYYDLIAENFDISEKTVAQARVLPSGVVGLIEANETEIAKADLITYQMDASSIIYATLSDTPDWDKYLDDETKALTDKILKEIENALTTNLKEHANEKLDDIIPKIKDAVLEKLPENTPFAENIFDAIVDAVVPYVMNAVTYVENKQGEIASKVEAMNEKVWGIAEKLAYAVVSYVAESKKAIEKIQEINPDATLVVTGMYNPFNGFEIVMDEEIIDVSEVFEYVVDAGNLYYNALAVENGGFAYVDISDAETNGFTSSVNATNLEISDLAGIVLRAGESMHANADGHVYIKDQIVKALTCDYSAYEKLDETYHYIICALCENKSATELHAFVGNTCEKCGYVKETTPPSNNYIGGGISVSSQLTIKFETNGGSKIESVKIERNEILTEPAAPTKEGFTFDGWYTDKELTNKYDFSQKVTKSFTLYAKWIEDEFKNPFVDVNEGDWFYDAVMFVLRKGITKGVSETEYAPQGKVTRAQFITMLCRAYEIEEMTGDNFADCGDTWYTGYLAAAKQLGISNGVGDNMFAPEKEITREEMVTLIYNYLKSINKVTEEAAELSFADSNIVSEWAKTAVAYAAKNGIVNGKGNNIFDPQGTATRAELAQIFYNMFK